ncbi:hypothetical protein CH063_15801 [Colletotrichum higginsianum]|nr:hypothetical protein CH063_15801 [Colletotrichum higginsianum]
MPEQCKVHFVEPDDSCESLADKYGATPKDLAEWNPLMYIQCDDFVYSKPTYICVGKPEKSAQVPWSQKQLHIPRFDD